MLQRFYPTRMSAAAHWLWACCRRIRGGILGGGLCGHAASEAPRPFESSSPVRPCGHRRLQLVARFRDRVPQDPSAHAHQAHCLSAAFSAIMIVGALVLPPINRGITEASMTRKPCTPRTRSWGSTTEAASPPMRQVPTGW